MNCKGNFSMVNIKKLLVQSIPTTIQLGSVLDIGHCFFDAMTQSLASIGTPDYTAKSLRFICLYYVVNLDRDVASQAATLNYQDYMANILYTAADIEAGTGLKIKLPIWESKQLFI